MSTTTADRPDAFDRLMADLQDSNARIHALREEAARAGDQAQVEMCDRALRRDRDAVEECARAILSAGEEV